MIVTRFLLVSCAFAAVLSAQQSSTASSENPDAVAGTVDGAPVTEGELQIVLAGSPRELQGTLQSSKEELLRYYGFMRKLAGQAEESKLDQLPPYSDRIRMMRLSILAEARLDFAYRESPVTNEEQRAHYESNKDAFAWAKTKVIYISFSDNPPAKQSKGAKKVLGEAEARKKAENVAEQARAGKDFVALVKEHSEHEESAAKDGDFGTIEASGKYPDEVKQAVFHARKGEIAGPVRLANGFYIFRIEDAGLKPYQEVQSQIFNELKEKRWQAWMQKTRESIQVKVGK